MALVKCMTFSDFSVENYVYKDLILHMKKVIF